MGFVERFGDGGADVEDLGRVERLAPDLLFQRLPLDILHRDEVQTRGIADLVDVGDVGLKLRGRLRFPFEAPQASRIGSEIRRKNLDGNAPVELEVLGQIDFPL